MYRASFACGVFRCLRFRILNTLSLAPDLVLVFCFDDCIINLYCEKKVFDNLQIGKSEEKEKEVNVIGFCAAPIFLFIFSMLQARYRIQFFSFAFHRQAYSASVHLPHTENYWHYTRPNNKTAPNTPNTRFYCKYAF